MPTPHLLLTYDKLKKKKCLKKITKQDIKVELTLTKLNLISR